jgi:UDP-N-acetylglucosamine 2-epimerase (non-hydrolysing)
MGKKIKVLTVFGTRPEATKMAPLILELEKNAEIESLCCVTAQHREMLDQVLEIFNIKPDFDLDIMQSRQTLSSITTRVLDRLDDVMRQVNPDLVLVHGDTSTTFSAALSAFYHKIKVGHVEAGLRTYDKYSPYPEEMNRQLTGRIADLHFCPTKQNKANLLAENIKNGIFITGNTAIDTVHLIAKDDYIFKLDKLNQIDFKNRKIILLTAHRRENYGEPLENIMRATKMLVEQFNDVEVIYPVHLSPAVRQTAQKELGGVERVNLIEPLSIDDNLNLMKRCYMVMTDSGGIQEEAPALGKPVLVLRKETERPEAVLAGTAALVGVDQQAIFEKASQLLKYKSEYDKMASAVNPYGDGLASRRILQAILYSFGMESVLQEFNSF